MREEFYAGLEDRKYLTLAEAQKKALAIDWAAPGARAPCPKQLGVRTWTDFPLEEVVPYIDWNPFFQVRVRRWWLTPTGTHSSR
jgi:5-methyltetrahydrofolate--homocysteine methyltransferase